MIIQQVGSAQHIGQNYKCVHLYKSIYNSCQMRLVTSTGPPVAVKVYKVQLIVQFKLML